MAILRRFALVATLLFLSASGLLAQKTFDPEARLRELGIELYKPDAPVANYVRAVRTGNLVFLAGHGECGGTRLTGKVGRDVTVDSAYASARRVGRRSARPWARFRN